MPIQTTDVFESASPASDTLRDRLVLTLIGASVVFAALGLGEAVYRLLFLEFDGATDRLPMELISGLALAWMVMKLAKRIYQSRNKERVRIQLIRERNRRIRQAIGALSPSLYPTNHQVLRVIREQVDHIDWTLQEMSR